MLEPLSEAGGPKYSKLFIAILSTLYTIENLQLGDIIPQLQIYIVSPPNKICLCDFVYRYESSPVPDGGFFAEFLNFAFIFGKIVRTIV